MGNLPQILQSVTQTWAASRSFPIDLSFLNPMRDSVSAVIDELVIVANLAITTGSAGLRGGATASMFSQIVVNDQAGERVNLRGSSLRVIDQAEYGSGYQDPTTIPATQTAAQTRRLFLRIPFNPLKARRGRDTGLNLRGFLDGGRLQFTTSAALIPGMGANGGTIGSGDITVYAHIRDEGVREAKSRLVYQDEAITLVNYDYNVAGALRSLDWYNGEINEAAGTAWSAQTITSKTLELTQVPDYILQDRYQTFSKLPRSSPGVVGTVDTYAQTDVRLTGQSVPIVMPDDSQKIPEMLQMQTVNVRTSLSSITTSDLPQAIKSYITERSASVTARVLGVSDPTKAAGERGRIKAANGNPRGVGAFPANIARMMPLKIGKGQS